jgi:hypothetical protein
MNASKAPVMEPKQLQRSKYNSKKNAELDRLKIHNPEISMPRQLIKFLQLRQ